MGEFNFDDHSTPVRKPAKSGISPVVWIGGIFGIALLGLAGMWLLNDTPAKLTLESIGDQTANENETFKITLKTQAEGLKPGEWSFGMLSGPPGSKIDPKTGVFTWTPNEDHGPGEHQVSVGVQATGTKRAQDKKSFKITVSEVNQPPVITVIPAQKVAAGESLRVAVKAKDSDKPAQTLVYKLKSGPQGAKIDAASGLFAWSVPESGVTGEQTVEIVVADAETGGAESETSFKIQIEPPASPLLRLAASIRAAGLTIESTTGKAPSGFTGTATHFVIDDELLTVLEYESEESARDDAAEVTDAGQTLFGACHMEVENQPVSQR